VKTHAGLKNGSSFRLAIFVVFWTLLARGFHPKARSHGPITALTERWMQIGWEDMPTPLETALFNVESGPSAMYSGVSSYQ
jgi:hypothetical protein